MYRYKKKPDISDLIASLYLSLVQAEICKICKSGLGSGMKSDKLMIYQIYYPHLLLFDLINE